jgi:hypothetical protein
MKRDPLMIKKKNKVVITFIEEIQQYDSVIRNFSSQTDGLYFLQDSVEDKYQDYLKPKNIAK